MRYHDPSDQLVRRYRARIARWLDHPSAGLPEGRFHKNRRMGCAPHVCHQCRAGKEHDILRPRELRRSLHARDVLRDWDNTPLSS